MSLIAKICVSIVCVNEEHKFLIVKEKRGDKITYNVPSGHVEAYETPAIAACREMKEETGLAPMNLFSIGTTLLKPFQGMKNAPMGNFYYTQVYGISADMCEFDRTVWPDVKANGVVILGDSDVQEAIWMSPYEIKSLESQWRNVLVLDKISMYRKLRHPDTYRDIDFFIDKFNPPA